jgi:rod shape determining protein RodA
MALTARHLGELFDWPLALAALGLVVAGWVGLLSATGATAASRTQGLASVQLLWVGFAFCAALAALWLPIRFWYGIAYIVYSVTLALLVLTLFYGARWMGAERWLVLGPIRVQASELGKVGLILALSRYLANHKVTMTRLSHFLGALAITLVPVALIRQQPDLGTAAVYLAIFLPMVYWAGLKNLHLFVLVVPIVNAICAFAGWIPWMAFCLAFVGLLFLIRPPVLWTVLLVVVNLTIGIITPAIWDRLEPFQQRRIQTFFSPEKDPLGAGYQIIQSQVAIGSGGMTGKGFQQGSQTQLAYLPETHTDFIFAVLGEEWGFAGTLAVVGLLLLLVWRTIRMGLATNNRFASFVCIGIGSMVAFQSVVNIGMTLGLMPVTGLPLPLVSYGGSATITVGFALGLVLSFGLRRYE